ncbi:35225_t:CDS:2 [Gigaspora margarita]|uniref:35225_t:CDS:1 n=1 Tax=Gigaspora margarita TaxID=4874 RepID=A0ABN7UQ41_GIGMA|nr:35225_t:CDS:2 [Gigaspora margarita]
MSTYFETDSWPNEFDEFPTHHALTLPSKIIKRIAQYLDFQHDRFNFCLVNKRWTPAATEILWSEPIFNTPDSFHSFCRSVRQSRSCALRVRVLDLCAPEDELINLFAPVLKSERQEHQKMRTYVLSKPISIMNLVRSCENLKSIKIYGWNLNDNHIQSLIQYCSGLEEFRVVGNQNLSQFSVYSLINCIPILRVLDLDGAFVLSDNFAETLATKCSQLTSLKICTDMMSVRGFDILAGKLTRLKELVLQNCSQLSDENIERFVRNNSSIQKMLLSGDKLSIRSFQAIISSLENLHHLDLRCLKEMSHTIKWVTALGQNLHTILLDNLSVDDDLIDILSNNCKHVEIFGLSRCPFVTDRSIDSIAEHSENLRIVNLVGCNKITDTCLRILANKACYTLVQLLIDSCGFFDPAGVRWFVSNTFKLVRITFYKMPSISESFVYQFATERYSDLDDSIDKCTIEGDNLKKLAQYNNQNSHSLEPAQNSHEKRLSNETNSLQNMHNLSEIQINALAIELGLSSDVLNRAMKKILDSDRSPASTSVIGDEFSHSTQNMSVKSVGNINHEHSHMGSRDSSRRTSKEFYESSVNEPISTISRRHTISSISSNSTQQFPPETLSSVIKKTQSGWSSINVKLPSLHRNSVDFERESLSSQLASNSLESTSSIQPKITNAVTDDTFDKHEFNENLENAQNKISNEQQVERSKSKDPVRPTEQFVFEQNTSFPTYSEPNKQSTSHQIYSEPNSHTLPNNDEEIARPSSALSNQSANSLIDFSPSWNGMNAHYDLGGWEELGITTGESVDNSQYQSFGQTSASSQQFEWSGNQWGKAPSVVTNEVIRATTSSNFDRDFSDQKFNKKELNNDFTYQNLEESEWPEISTKSTPTHINEEEWPTLGEVSKIKDSKKSVDMDFNFHGQTSINFSSAWGSNKKWISDKSDTAPPNPEPPTPTWDPNEVNNLTWLPIQEAKAPIYFKKKHTPIVNFDLDDCEGWGAPPTKCIPWNDSRQGYCFELIEEQKETTFWSLQNGNWVNVSEENHITEQISEYSSDGSNVRQMTRTRFGRQEIQSRSTDAPWDELRQQVRNGSEERGLTMSDTGEIGNVVIELDKEFHERLGNPQWIPKHEWLQNENCVDYPKPEINGDLINFDLPDISDSKSSSDDSEEPLSSTPNRDEDSKIIRKPDSHPEWENSLNLSGKEINIDLTFDDNIPLEDTGLENDSWFANDIIATTRNEQKHIAELNNSLYDSTTYSTISPTNCDLMDDSMDLYYFNRNENNNALMSVNNDNRSLSPQVNCNIRNFRHSTDTISNQRSDTNGSIVEDMMEFKAAYQTDDTRSTISMRDISDDFPEVNLVSSIITHDIKKNKSQYKTIDDQEEISDNSYSMSNGGDPSYNLDGDDNKFNIFVETPLNGRQILEMRVDDDADTVAANFCRTWQMSEYQEGLKGLIVKAMKKKLRQRKKRLARQSDKENMENV